MTLEKIHDDVRSSMDRLTALGNNYTSSAESLKTIDDRFNTQVNQFAGIQKSVTVIRVINKFLLP